MMKPGKSIFHSVLILLLVLVAGYCYSKETKVDTKSLAGVHAQDNACTSCHTEDMKVSDSETHINAQCRECHGGYDKLQNDELEIDPHNSHLGDVNCTSCHHGHEKPVYYCNKCHAFANVEMPFNDAPEKPAWDKDWNQQAIDEAISKGHSETCDVIVVGAGSAGFNAAIVARRAGAKVIQLEKGPFSGGNSMLTSGGYNAAGTPQQKKAGIEDKTEWLIEDTMKGGRGLNNRELVTVLAENSVPGLQWLESLGVNMDDLRRFGGARVNRAHRPHGGANIGPAVVFALRAAAKNDGVDLRVNSRVEKLLTDDKGNMSGVVVHGKHSGYYVIHAKAVVLATGGFGFNKEMVASYQPTFKEMTSSNNVTSTGDGVRLAKEVGASFTDMEWIQAHPTVGADSRILVSESNRGAGAILVNKNGARFVDELTTRDKASAATLEQPGGFSWLVFDKQLFDATAMVRGYKHLDMLKEGNTLAELAKACGMDPATFEETIKKYNTYQKNGKDEEFGRADMPLSVSEPPFYATRVAPGVHYTMGGVTINTMAQVMNEEGKWITGLFAAGEVTGGVHGANRLGGNSILDTVVFGLIAGENAAKFAEKK